MSEPAAGRARPGLLASIGIITLAAFTAIAVVSVALAWTGHLRAALLYPAWIAVALGLIALALPLGRRVRRPHPGTIAAAVVIALFTALNLATYAQHVQTTRDPGVYVVAGRSLARTGTTTAPGVVGTPFATLPGAAAGSSAYADTDRTGRQVELLPSPGLPALLATVQLAGGDGAMFALMPLMASVALAFFAALATRVAGPWFGAVALAALAASLAEAYIARDAFAEVPTQGLVLGGYWLLLRALDDGGWRRALLAGAAIGATVAIHFPALVVIAALVVATALEAILAPATADGAVRIRTYLGACATALPLAAFGVLGLRHWNRAYERPHETFIRDFVALILVSLAVCAVALALRGLGRVPALDGSGRRIAGRIAAGAVAVATIYGLLIRPSVERGHDPVLSPTAMAALQRAAHVAVEPDRSYAELTLRWLADYMGPVALVLGLAGLAWACVCAMRPAASHLRLTLPLAVLATAVYCLRPAAYPDQPWVIRRFAPEVIPLLLLYGTWVLREIWFADWRARTVRRTAVVVGAVLAVVAPLLVLRPVARASVGHHGGDLIHAFCGQVGPDAAVLVTGGPPTTRWYPDTIRAFCGVPTASADQPDRAALQRLAAAWARQGRRLVVVGSGPSALARLGVPAVQRRTIVVVNPYATEIPINRPPDHYRPTLSRLSYAPIAAS